jgi:hypothetical protein
LLNANTIEQRNNTESCNEEAPSTHIDKPIKITVDFSTKKRLRGHGIMYFKL